MDETRFKHDQAAWELRLSILAQDLRTYSRLQVRTVGHFGSCPRFEFWAEGDGPTLLCQVDCWNTEPLMIPFETKGWTGQAVINDFGRIMSAMSGWQAEWKAARASL